MKEEAVFPKKYSKLLNQEFIDAVEQMQSDDIKSRILNCENNLYDIEVAKTADAKLAELKEKVKNLASIYTENKSKETAKLKYCLYVLQGRGVEL